MGLSSSPLRVVIDARPLSHPQVGGFRSHVRALVQGLAERNGPEKILLYLDRPLPPDAPPLSDNMEIRILDRRRLRTDLLLFGRQVARDRPDLVHGTTNCLPPYLGGVAAATVTIHDALQLKRYPFVPVERKLRGRLHGRYEAWLTRRTVRRARRILTVSAASGVEIRHALRIDGDRIRVVPNGILLHAADGAPPRSPDTVLALASTDPRKNFDLLLRAFANEGHRFARPPRLQIVCTNATSAAYVEQAAHRHGISEGMCLLRSPDDAELAACYARAAVFVFPSWLEGFGMPPLEAMAAGCPVASSSAPAMPEILGDAPLWFAPDRPDQLADAIAAFLNDPRLREAASRRGRAHAAQFTCRRMAEQTLAVWREALG